ncbi:MAG: hypothetical protein H6632_12780 [Anaerolineales bacterium]|nr:hypothetical protein [Anaerolineales bacterium]
MDIRQTISDGKGWFERITSKIPLYKGYKQKEEAREADMLLREHIAKQLAEQLRAAEDVTGQLLTGPGLAQLDDMGQGNMRLQTLIDKIKTAAQGYAGLFDSVKIKEAELETLYQFDDRMLTKVDEIGEAVNSIQAAIDESDSSKIAASVRRYIKTVSDTSELFDRRKDVLLGLA